MSGIIGKKLGMTQVYDDKGRLVPVTVIEAGPCPVLETRTQAKNGYSALQLGFGAKKVKNVTKAVLGHLAKTGNDKTPPAIIREIRLTADANVAPGAVVTVESFKDFGFVDVQGMTKGRGFMGVVRRYRFRGGRASHGGGWIRRPGSSGMREWPGRVLAGKRYPGHMGAVTRTVQNLQIVQVRTEENVLLVKGAVPGHRNGLVIVRKAIKK